MKSDTCKRDWIYILGNIRLMFKRMIEYKINFWSSIQAQVTYFIIFMGFMGVISSNFGDVILWTTMDFIMFLVIVDTIKVLEGIFYWKIDLFNCIKNGELNTYIYRPNNVLIGYYFSWLNPVPFVMFCFNIVILTVLFVLNSASILSVVVGIFLIVLCVIFGVLVVTFIESFNFYSLGLVNSLFDVLSEMLKVVETYPFGFFQNSFMKYFMFIISCTFAGSLIVPVIKGYDIWNLNLQLFILIGGIILFAFGTVINWHYGLKKYEGFG